MPKPPPSPPPFDELPDEPLDGFEENPFDAPPTVAADPSLSHLAGSEIRRAELPQRPEWQDDAGSGVTPIEETFEGDFDEIENTAESPQPDKRRLGPVLKVLGVIALVVAIVVGVLAYRSRHQQKVIAEGVARATAAIALDTAAGYRQAALLLEPLTAIDPVEVGALRAFALAMLFADYRDEQARDVAEVLLVEPERASQVPPYANLARAALAMARREGGTAITSLSRTPGAWGPIIEARVALMAANLPAAADALESSLATDPKMVAALALRGDVQRRQKNYDAARASYLSALELSPNHARATFGLAKLALSGKTPTPDALAPLERLLADREGTLSNERGRAALHLAALYARLKEPTKATNAIDAAGLDPTSRAWLERAAAREELDQGDYRPVEGAPADLLSASDDDPYDSRPRPVPPVAKPAPAPAAQPAAKTVRPTAKPAVKRAVKPAAKKATKAASRATAKKATPAPKKKAAAKPVKPTKKPVPKKMGTR